MVPELPVGDEVPQLRAMMGEVSQLCPWERWRAKQLPEMHEPEHLVSSRL